MQLVEPGIDHDKKMLPPSIYAALVHSLFQNYGPVFAGVLCAVAAAVMTVWKTGNPWLWSCAALIIVVGAARAYQMKLYEDERRAQGPLTPDGAKWWEPRYKFGADLYAASLGVWCFVVLVW